jgi:4-hydroxy 2-oxovalerate aldolase
MKITDCTIRDGGHLNKWNFDPICVKAAYYAALKGGVDYFEIGYRFPEAKKGLGPFGYCTDAYLNALLEVNDKCKLLVMIDAGKADSVNFEICTSGKTPIKGVRVAAYPYEYPKAISLIENLTSKGYEVFLNLMASSEITEAQYTILENWKNKEILEAVNFADSFGSYTPSDIPKYISKLKGLGFKSIGFHSHNNLQMAFANALRAIEEGATYIDASILGMGRGSGNLPVEIFLGYLEKEGHLKYNTVPYLDVIERFFNDLFNKYSWGYKLQSLLGGLKNIHPYYIDELFAKKSYTIAEIWNASDFIKENCPTSFSIET